MNVTVHTDGGARGNPGPAAVGVVIQKEGKEVAAFGKAIGDTTNNVAEYTAVIEALTKIKQLSLGEVLINFYLDSTLVVNQLNGLFKIKDARLRELISRVRILEQEAGGRIHYTYVPREENRRADFLVNQALDQLMLG